MLLLPDRARQRIAGTKREHGGFFLIPADCADALDPPIYGGFEHEADALEWAAFLERYS